jgi:hypothetical protein
MTVGIDVKTLFYLATFILISVRPAPPMYIYNAGAFICVNALREHHEVKEECETITCEFDDGTEAIFFVCDGLEPSCIARNGKRQVDCPKRLDVEGIF